MPIKRRPPDPSKGTVRGRAVDADADRRSDAGARFAVGLVLAVAASVFATSVLFFAQNQFRADHWVYGRQRRPCMRCRTRIEAREVGALPRVLYWCPRCQAAR